jgi:quinol monooxygenase YgiN
MVTKGLLVRLEAKPGHEDDVEQFLHKVMPVIDREPATIALFGLRLGPSTFGIFNAFPDEAGRQTHIGGDAAIGLTALATSALAVPPSIEAVDVIAAKLPERRSAAA